jgi:hypothetical protein
MAAQLAEDLPALVSGVGIPTEGSIFTVWNMLLNLTPAVVGIYDATGIPTGDATTTVLGRLAAIERLALCACGPQPPSPEDVDGCASPVLSALSAAPSGYDGRVFAYWLELPDGAQLAGELDPAVEGAEIEPVSTWAGWSAFILSKSSTIASLDPRSPIVSATNQWLSLDTVTFAAFNVPAGNDITVYLCRDETVPIGCVNINSHSSTASGAFSATLEVLSAAPAGMSFVNPVNSSSGEVSWSPPAFISGNLSGWTLEVFSGSVRLVYRTDDPSSSAIYSIGGPYTSADGVVSLPTTNHFSMDDNDTDTPFSLQLCNVGA